MERAARAGRAKSTAIINVLLPKSTRAARKKTVRKQWLEDLVVNQTMQLVKDDAAMESIIAKVMDLQNKENTNIPLYEKQLRDAESGIQNMLNAIQAGILTSSTKERLEQLEETKRELEARIAEEKLAKPKIKEEFYPLLADAVPQAGYEPERPAAGVGGYLHQCDLPV